MTLATTSGNSLTIRPELGQAANQAASLHSFDDWKARRAANTIKRTAHELANFADFLATLENSKPLDLFNDPHAWQGITWGLVKAFTQYQLQAGYSIGSVNLHLSTIKTFSKLATAAGVMQTEAWQ